MAQNATKMKQMEALSSPTFFRGIVFADAAFLESTHLHKYHWLFVQPVRRRTVVALVDLLAQTWPCVRLLLFFANLVATTGT